MEFIKLPLVYDTQYSKLTVFLMFVLLLVVISFVAVVVLSRSSLVVV